MFGLPQKKNRTDIVKKIDRENHQQYINDLSQSIALLNEFKEARSEEVANQPQSTVIEEHNDESITNSEKPVKNAIVVSSEVSPAGVDPAQIGNESPVTIDTTVSEEINESVCDQQQEQIDTQEIKPVFTLPGNIAETTNTSAEKKIRKKTRKKKKLRPWVKFATVGFASTMLLFLASASADYTFSKEVDSPEVIVNNVSQTETRAAQTDTIPTTPGEADDTQVENEVKTDQPKMTIPAGIPSDVLLKMKQADANADADSSEKSEDTSDEPVERPEPLGTRGRLYFENGWSVALNYADSYDTEEMQQMADAYDSACYMEDSGKVMIADHASQGFEIIKKYAVGSKATIVDENGEERTIVCKAIYPDAYWEDGYTHLPDGRGIWGATDGKIGLQTANTEDGLSVTVSYWDYE